MIPTIVSGVHGIHGTAHSYIHLTGSCSDVGCDTSGCGNDINLVLAPGSHIYLHMVHNVDHNDLGMAAPGNTYKDPDMAPGNHMAAPGSTYNDLTKVEGSCSCTDHIASADPFLSSWDILSMILLSLVHNKMGVEV